MAGWPRSVPYGADAGEHMIGIQPAGDLAPCTWYRAGVTANLVDARNQAVTPMTWDFRTGTDAAGNRCADDPYTANENFVRKVTSDLLDRRRHRCRAPGRHLRVRARSHPDAPTPPTSWPPPRSASCSSPRPSSTTWAGRPIRAA